jgi:hypothetical protein
MMANETFTPAELDELSGALLFTGSLTNAVGAVLDVTLDPESFELIEFINHLPVEVAVPLLVATAMAIEEAQARLGQASKATRSAIESAAAIVQAQADEAEESELSV